jgi:DNA-binding transcriptional LysR family regulator
MSLDLDLLTTFAKVAERASVTAAARDLNLSKATVSKQIAELEQKLGVLLFARTTRLFSLTESGQRAYVRAQRIMAEAEALVDEARETRDLPRGNLKIAAPQAFARLWLADLLPEFIRAYPEISLEFGVDERTVDMVKDNFDVAIRIGTMPDSSLLARKLAPVRLFTVASPAYWKKHGKPRRPEDLALHCCFRYTNTPNYSLWRYIDGEGNDLRVRVQGPITTNGGQIEMPALREGLGVAYLPDFLVCEDVRAGRLERALEDWCSPELTLHLLSPPGRGKPKRLEVFADFMITKFGGRTPPWHI